MHWLAWTVLGCWLVPVPYLIYTVRQDTISEKRCWHTGWAAMLWPVVLICVVLVALLGNGKRWFS